MLFGQPGQSFYTNEIIKKSGGGSGAVQRELSRLVRSGLVTVTRIGSQKLAFGFGSVAKGEDTASSDIDLMIISESLTYADVFPGLEKASVGMGRAIQPSLYPLDNLAGAGGSLAAEPPDPNEFNGLKKSGLARLHDAAITTLSLESRFDLGYNAAHALCLAALRRLGYRAKHTQLAHTIAHRVGRFLERQDLLERDMENSYLSGDAAAP